VEDATRVMLRLKEPGDLLCKHSLGRLRARSFQVILRYENSYLPAG
jgi:hypothetical protein